MGQIVTLTTDWGYSDFFIGKVKGRLSSLIPDVQVVDITHGIRDYNLMDTAFIVANTCFDFPEGTIHIIDVCSTETPANPFVIVECEGQYFICADNGVLSIVIGDRDYNSVQITYMQDSNFFTFAAYNLFCYIAQELAAGTPISELGSERERLNRARTPLYMYSENTLHLVVIYIDAYGNGYLNIKYDEFERIRAGRDFYITMAGQQRSKMRISRSYADSYLDAGSTGIILTVSATGHLQLAMSNNPASKMLDLAVTNNTIFIDFA